MFSTLKILVIYLIIPSRCTCIPTTPTSNDKTTTQSVREKVKKEMNDFNKILNQIKDDPIRYQLKGKLEEVLKRAVKSETENKMLLEDKRTIKNQKNDYLQKLKTLAIPLVFRNYANKIEDKFPTIPSVPPNVMRNQLLHQGVLQRKYHWIDILSKDEYSNDAHVILIKKALKENFFLENNIPIEKEIQDLADDQKQMYSKFLENFCEGIAVSVDYVNKIVAHNAFGRFPINDLLNVFEPAYDKYVSLFYKAVVNVNDSQE